MLKVTTRYLASHFIPPFVLGFVFFLTFLITFYMFRIISIIVNKGVDFYTIFSMLTNLSISFFPLAAPLSAFFATIYTLNKLSEDSEIIAMRSFGYTKFKIFLPFLTISLAISIMVNSLYSDFIPKANASFKNTVLRLTSSGMLNSIKSGQFFTDIPNVTLFADEVTDDGVNFNQVFLHVNDKGKQEEKVIFSKKGSLIKIFADEWHTPSLRLHLTDGNIIRINDRGEKLEKILFKEYDFPVLNSDFAVSLLDKDSMKSNNELREIIKLKEENLDENKSDKNVDKVKELRISLSKTKVEYYSRFVTFTQIMLFTFIGFSLGVKKGRGPSGNNSAIAFLTLVLYFAIYFFLISLAQKAKLDPFIANFFPSLLLLVLGLKFYKKLDWGN